MSIFSINDNSNYNSILSQAKAVIIQPMVIV